MMPEIRFEGFESEWGRKSLGSITTSYNNIRVPIDSSKRKEGPYPYYGATGIVDYVEGYIFEGEYVLLAEDGENIISRNAPISYITSGKFWVNNHAHVMRIIDGSNHYLKHYLESFDYTHLNTGTAQPKLNSKTVQNIEVFVPDFKEQKLVGNFLENIEENINLKESELIKLNKFKQAMLQKMFPKEGETVPEIRFEGFKEEWERSNLESIIEVINLNNYITTPKKTGKYPVIQQGNNPIIGYTDINEFKLIPGLVLFGDHTLSLYKPQTDFSVSTDGIKGIRVRGYTQNFTNALLEKYKPDSEGYKRHLSILKKKEVIYPLDKNEATLIGNYFNKLDQNIQSKQAELKKLKQFKQAMLDKMFV